jgi:hypothetical protein
LKTYAPGQKSTILSRQKTSKQVTSAIQSGTKILQLIRKFKEVEAKLIAEFSEDLKTQFIFACATSDQIMTGDERTLSVASFLEFGLNKKIRFNEELLVEVLDGKNVVGFEEFMNLLILASCGGERTKLGVNNFTKLMSHMGIKQVV